MDPRVTRCRNSQKVSRKIIRSLQMSSKVTFEKYDQPSDHGPKEYALPYFSEVGSMVTLHSKLGSKVFFEQFQQLLARGPTEFVLLYFSKSIGWRRLIGCLQLQVKFRKRATNYRALLRKMTYINVRHPMTLRHPAVMGSIQMSSKVNFEKSTSPH